MNFEEMKKRLSNQQNQRDLRELEKALSKLPNDLLDRIDKFTSMNIGVIKEFCDLQIAINRRSPENIGVFLKFLHICMVDHAHSLSFASSSFIVSKGGRHYPDYDEAMKEATEAYIKDTRIYFKENYEKLQSAHMEKRGEA